MLTVTGIIFLPVAAVLWALGYRVAIEKRTDLIAGFDSGKIRDPDGYAGWLGAAAIVCGLGLLVTWILIAMSVLPERRMLAGVLISAAVALLLARVGRWRHARR